MNTSSDMPEGVSKKKGGRKKGGGKSGGRKVDVNKGDAYWRDKKGGGKKKGGASGVIALGDPRVRTGRPLYAA